MENTGLRLKEDQTPNLEAGYHHEWSPGNQTLLFAGRFDDSFSFTNTSQPSFLIFRPAGTFTSVEGLNFHEHFRGNVQIYATEAQQILEQTTHTTIAGVRGQYGRLDTANLQNFPSTDPAQFSDPAADQNADSFFRRISCYGYHHWQILDSFLLIGGVSYDWIAFPENFRRPPLSSKERTVDQISPKAGFIWTPITDSVIRFAYTRSI